MDIKKQTIYISLPALFRFVFEKFKKKKQKMLPTFKQMEEIKPNYAKIKTGHKSIKIIYF